MIVTIMNVPLKNRHIHFLINRVKQSGHPEVKGSQIVVKGVLPQWEVVTIPAGAPKFFKK